MAHSDSSASVPNVGPYRCERLVWSGRRHDVWLAKGPFDVNVAAKVARDTRDGPRLDHEALAISRVDHPALVRLMDKAPDGAWLILEWVKGEPIDQWSRAHSIHDLMQTTIELVAGLSHMHQHGVVHGDIKPSNVVVNDQGQPTLIDFGVATLEEEEAPEFRGTLGFCAPELLRGARPSPASDLYSLGALLYFCLTGNTPFNPDDPAALTYLPVESLPVPPSTWTPQVPLLLEQAVMKLLARSPENRPSDLAKVRMALQKVPTSRASRPILGMTETRDRMRRAVVSAADGKTQVVVVYGPPGCGRTVHIDEAVEAARREGLVYLRDSTPTLAIASMVGAERPSVVRFEADMPGAIDVARQVLDDKLAALVLLRSERALPELGERGAIQLTPPLMSREDAVSLITALGGQGELASRWWKESGGLPAGIIGRFRAWRRSKLKEGLDLSPLSPMARRILDELIGMGPVPIPDLAQKMDLGEHQLLDHCAVLFAEELVEAAEGGSALIATPAATPQHRRGTR